MKRMSSCLFLEDVSVVIRISTYKALLLPDISVIFSVRLLYYLMLSEETGLSSQLHSALLAAMDSTSHGLPLLVVNCDSVHLSY